MLKTPVSILQEMMAKENNAPNYELIFDGGGSHMNTFTYRVLCKGLSAIGTGRSKKDAKHEAAKNMLETIAADRAYLQLPASPAQSPVRTPLQPSVPISPRIPPNVPFMNAIGALQDLCSQNNLQDPEYILVSDIGPPHARVFTYKCVVATFKEEGIAGTKKQAKHEAAKKMFDKITDLISNKLCTLDCKRQNEETLKKDIIANEIAKARYPELSKLVTKKSNLGIKLSEYHLKLKQCFDDATRKELLDALQSLVDNAEEINNESLETRFTNFLENLNLTLSTTCLQSEDEKFHVIVKRIDAFVDICQIAVEETKAIAEFNATLRLIHTFQLLLM